VAGHWAWSYGNHSPRVGPLICPIGRTVLTAFRMSQRPCRITGPSWNRSEEAAEPVLSGGLDVGVDGWGRAVSGLLRFSVPVSLSPLTLSSALTWAI
jgi:hypothetical protein